VVDVVDGFGNRVAAATDVVTVSLAGGEGTLIGPNGEVGSVSVAASAGRVVFAGLRIRGPSATSDTLGPGVHQLRFAASGFSDVVSANLNVEVSYGYNVQRVYDLNGCVTCHGLTYANSVNQPTGQARAPDACGSCPAIPPWRASSMTRCGPPRRRAAWSCRRRA